MKIRDFGVEIWMGLYEYQCKYNLGETCVESMTVDELLDIVGNKHVIIDEILNMKLTYGEIEGSIRLRKAIAKLYDNIAIENISVTHGGIGANALVYQTLLDPGDRVISLLPTYQQHYSIPEAFGADVKIVKAAMEDDYEPNLDEIRSAVNDRTKMICITNPCNPTGSLMEKPILMEIVQIARQCGAYLFADEAYRGLSHSGNPFVESVVDLYEKGIATSSMSKSYALAGLRLGWITGPQDFIKAINKQRDYTTISCAMIDDRLAAAALENKEAVLERNFRIVRENLALVEKWIATEPLLSYVKPKAGTTVFPRYNLDMPSEEFALRLLKEKEVLVVPGSAFDMEGFFRLGYASVNADILQKGLAGISEFLRELS